MRRLDTRRIKAHHPYTAKEAARTLGVAVGTVRRWITEGLTAHTDRRPHLIRGDDLATFLCDRRPEKRTCALNECWCFGCRAPSAIARGEALLVRHAPTNGNLHAPCERCGREMHKRVRLDRLDELLALGVVVTVVEPDSVSAPERQPDTVSAPG